jgi:uncharacterized protein with HEPN domain
MLRDNETLLDIAKAARSVLSFIEGYDEDAFLKDEKTKSAVIHQMLIIGEAVKRLTEVFREMYHDIPWKPMARMRDRLIHQYDAVDWDEVWRTASIDVPQLLRDVEPLLPKREV